jgi:hypothetical protein
VSHIRVDWCVEVARMNVEKADLVLSSIQRGVRSHPCIVTIFSDRGVLNLAGEPTHAITSHPNVSAPNILSPAKQSAGSNHFLKVNYKWPTTIGFNDIVTWQWHS